MAQPVAIPSSPQKVAAFPDSPVATLDLNGEEYCDLKGPVDASSTRQSNGHGLNLVYTGRFEPYHLGHHEIVRSLLRRDASIFPGGRDRSIFLNSPIRRLVIAVAEKPVDANNPLTVGQRRLLIGAAVEDDPTLIALNHMISVEWMPHRNTVAEEHAALLSALPPIAEACFITGNPATLVADRASGFKCLTVKNRSNVTTQSATSIRRLILQGTSEAMGEVKCRLPRAVYLAMEEFEMFEQIRRVCAGG